MAFRWRNGETREKARISARQWMVRSGVLISLIAIFSILYGAVNLTSTPSFCSNCHEMTPEQVTFEASTHSELSCEQCHMESGINRFIGGQAQILKEYLIHEAGPPGVIMQTSVIPNEICEKCHSKNRLVTATGDLIVNHQGHIKKDIPCTTCHGGVVHAKIFERGLNGPSTYNYWTKETAKKLMNEKFKKTNMGTCIDCHEQVNQGKEPWLEAAYSLPERIHEDKKEKTNGFEETPEMKAGTLERELPINKQNLILEAIGKQQTNEKISMKCSTCHREINTPKNHEINNWSEIHGYFAVKDLGECLECHQDSLWLKETGKQNIRELLIGGNKGSTAQHDLISVGLESRKNYFCSTCHAAYRPADHLDRSKWLFDTHRAHSGSPEERRVCFVCHDNKRPEGNTSNAPSDVYCEFCHSKGDFPGEP